MADIAGYINPRSLGNNEPNEALKMDIFFETAFWDKYIANKNTRRRDLYTWDAMAPYHMQSCLGGLRAGFKNRDPKPGETLTTDLIKIGHHKPASCVLICTRT